MPVTAKVLEINFAAGLVVVEAVQDGKGKLMKSLFQVKGLKGGATSDVERNELQTKNKSAIEKALRAALKAYNGPLYGGLRFQYQCCLWG